MLLFSVNVLKSNSLNTSLQTPLTSGLITQQNVANCFNSKSLRGIKIMSIADRNSVKAIDEAKEAAAKLNIKYIPGIEIDCTYNGIKNFKFTF